MALDVLMPGGVLAPASPLGMPMAFTLGFTFGMGPCLLACLPWLGTVYLNSDGGLRRSWRVILPVSLGRLTAYTGFALGSAWFGQAVSQAASAGHAGERLGWEVGWVLGAAALLVGLALLSHLKKPTADCSSLVMAGASRPLRFHARPGTPRTLMPGGLFLMGLAMALTPCAPLGVVLVAAAAVADPLPGAGLGLSFGLGAVLVPGLVYGLGAAWFGQQLRLQLGPWRERIQFLSALLLILTGALHLLRPLF